MAKTSAFDENVSAYDAWFDANRQLYQAELEAVLGFIPPQGRGVEIGVDTGRFAVPLGITVGVEPSPRMADLARKRGVQVIEGVAEALPFADGTFDFVLMVTVVCFLEDVTRAFREAFRILRPGGILIVGSSTGTANSAGTTARGRDKAASIGRPLSIPPLTWKDAWQRRAFPVLSTGRPCFRAVAAPSPWRMGMARGVSWSYGPLNPAVAACVMSDYALIRRRSWRNGA